MVRHDAAIARWLRAAVADVEARGLPELKGLLEGLAESTRELRAAELVDSTGADAFASRLGMAAGASGTHLSAATPKSDERVDSGRTGEDDADHC